MTPEQRVAAFRDLLRHFSGYKNFDDIRLESPADLDKIPLTSRQDVLSFPYEAARAKVRWIRNTSGSTGSECLFYTCQDGLYAYLERCNRAFEGLGVLDSTMMAMIEEAGQLYLSLRTKGPLFFQAFGPNWARDLAVRKMRAVRPEVLLAPPPAIVELMGAIVERDFLKKLIIGGTVIPPAFRERLRQISGAEVRVVYTCTEFGILGHQEHDNDEPYVVNDQGLLLEVKGEDGVLRDFGRGSLVITDFNNRAMPMVRYEIGDLVELSEIKGQKRIVVFGKHGDHIKLADDVTEKAFLVFTMIQLVGTDEFVVEVDTDPGSMRDYLEVHLQPERMVKAPAVEAALAELYDVDLRFVSLTAPVPRFGRGKARNIVDRRVRA